MRTLRAGIAAILCVAVMGITFSGCSNDKESSSNSGDSSVAAEVSNNGDANNEVSSSTSAGDDADIEVDEDVTDFLKQDAVFSWGEQTETSDSGNSVQDPTEAPEKEITVVTEYVAVTEAGGAVATDAKGETVTEVVTATQAANEQSGNTYTPAMDNFRSYWLDMTSNNGEYDKVFNGEFLVVTFKIKEGTPDGNYAITMSNQDFVNWDEEQLDVKTVDGYVTVGSAVPTAAGQAQPGQFTIQAIGAKGNVGDEVEVVFNVNDNPGLVGYIFNFQYDKNALEIVNARIGDDCSDIIHSVND